MPCFRMRALFSPYIDGELSPSLRGVLERHLASCPACRRELESWRALSGALRLLGEEPVAVPPDFRAGVMARLPAREAAGRHRSGWFRPLRVAAAAAALAVLAGGATLAAGLTGRASHIIPSPLAHRAPEPVVVSVTPTPEEAPSGGAAPQPRQNGGAPEAPSLTEATGPQSGGAPSPPPAGEQARPETPAPSKPAGGQVAFTSRTAERVAVSLWLEVPRLADATAEIATLAQQYCATQKNTLLGPGADGRARMLVSLSASPEDYEALVARLASVGRETDRRVTRTDVTSELAALEGELVRLKARVEELRRQGADAAPLEDQIRSLERKREDLLRATVAVWLTETGTAPR